MQGLTSKRKFALHVFGESVAEETPVLARVAEEAPVFARVAEFG